MEIPKSNAEARLLQAKPCGVVRNSHEMTMVRFDDVQYVLDSVAHYRARANTLDAEHEQIVTTKDDALKEVSELRKGIAAAIQTLQATACAMR